MLAECVDNCPSDLWLSGGHPRPYWKIAYHVTVFAHCFLFPSFDTWERWPHHRSEAAWTVDEEGVGIPVVEPYSTDQVMDYIRLIQDQIDMRIDALDLEDDDCGFPWYKDLSRADLLILNTRHISEHVGQLHELRIAVGLEVDWRATRDD
jgi:hypothetical protein